MRFEGFARKTGRLGVRNTLLVLYTVNCASHVARRIAARLNSGPHIADVLGNESCFDNQTVIDRMLALIGHPNVGAVLLVGHGCEFIRADRLAAYARSIEKPVDVVMDQELGTEAAIQRGLELAGPLLAGLKEAHRAPSEAGKLLAGVLEDGDADSPEGRAARMLEKRLLDAGAGVVRSALDCSFESVREDIARLHQKQEKFARINNIARAPRAAVAQPPQGVLRLGQSPRGAGLWLIDTLQDAQMERGLAATDSASRAMDLVCAGAQVIICASGGRSVCGVAISPVFSIGGRVAAMEADCLCTEEPWSRFTQVLGGAETASERLGMFEGFLHASC